MWSNTHNRRSFSRQALVSLSLCVCVFHLQDCWFLSSPLNPSDLTLCQSVGWSRSRLWIFRQRGASGAGGSSSSSSSSSRNNNTQRSDVFDNSCHPAPDHVTSPGVLSFSLLYGAFIYLLYEGQTFPNLAVSGTSCKRWTSPRCSLATASLSLQPSTISPLSLSQLLGALGRVCKQKAIPRSPVIGGAVFPAEALCDDVICLVLRRLVLAGFVLVHLCAHYIKYHICSPYRPGNYVSLHNSW